MEASHLVVVLLLMVGLLFLHLLSRFKQENHWLLRTIVEIVKQGLKDQGLSRIIVGRQLKQQKEDQNQRLEQIQRQDDQRLKNKMQDDQGLQNQSENQDQRYSQRLQGQLQTER
jgi:hypothetical protein